MARVRASSLCSALWALSRSTIVASSWEVLSTTRRSRSSFSLRISSSARLRYVMSSTRPSTYLISPSASLMPETVRWAQTVLPSLRT